MLTLADPRAWPAPRLPDAEAAREAFERLGREAVASAQTLSAQVFRAPEPLAFDPSAFISAWTDFGLGLARLPFSGQAAQPQSSAPWLALYQNAFRRMAGLSTEPVIAPARGDRRFSHPLWTEHPLFAQIKEFYLLGAEALNGLVARAEGLDDEGRKRVGFVVRQYLDAIAPSNFAATNPEVISRTLETGGLNLVSGLANLLADIAAGEGLVSRRAQDTFELGVNIAATPGGVVGQTELFQLIQYEATAETVGRRPVLYVPPLVNKYYMMDLQPHTSPLKWLVDSGRTVFVVSWVNPGSEHHEKDLASYVVDGVASAMDMVSELTGEPDVDVAGFCMGGTLAALAAAYLTADGRGDRVGSLTLIGSLTDFSDLRDWSIFASEGDLRALDGRLDEKGYLASADLQKLFSVMRANDLIWPSVVNHYLLDRDALPSDLLWWFADGARIPAGFMRSFGDLLLRGNLLVQPGALKLRGVPLDLAKVTAPVLMISLKDDHVSAWDATYRGARLFGGPTQFLLGGSGHNAGVINPPSGNRHGYWTNPELPEDAAGWFAGAEKSAGSWWPHWRAWLGGHDERMVAPHEIGCGVAPVIEPAPGSYVRMR